MPMDPCPVLHKFKALEPNHVPIWISQFIKRYTIKNKLAPCFATITLDTASGTDVPAARKVIPITESGIINVSPEM